MAVSSMHANYVPGGRSSPKPRPRVLPPSAVGERLYGRGPKGFFAWMRAKAPRLYSAAMPAVKNPNLSGLGITGDATEVSTSTTNSGTASANWVDSLKNLLTSVGQAYLTKEQLDAQKKILNVQLQRAQAGLAPLNIDMSQYGMVPTAQVGLTSQTRSLLMWGIAGIAGVFLVSRLIKR